MSFLYTVFSIALGTLLIAGVVEQRRHQRNLDSIPSRVLVNGIRGKSSVTRLCAGALRGGGLTVVAKTTGTAARFIHPDATEEPVHRKFDIANVVEQIGIVRRAAAAQPDVLVMECMAVMPPLQEVNQTKLIQSTIGVLSNVREDHLQEMGPTLQDVARSLSRSMPVGGICVTAERDLLHILQQEADKRSCRLIAVDPDDITDEDMSGFRHHSFKENVAISLEVARLLGIPRDMALKGMWQAPPDPGVLTVESYRFGSKSLHFANVFAANDPRSTVMNVQELIERQQIQSPVFTLINCRPDRVERNGQMGEIVPELLTDKLFVIGHPSKSALVKVPSGWDGSVFDLGGANFPVEDVLRTIVEQIDQEASLVAIGNIHGQGEILLRHLERTGVPC
ncbi:poly-gamma-glutamate synthase PgsB/CapB [Kibdelosporangium banguiense]|uniref:Poly-gamma-glutamate synthase PgsB/CapB n=1 Tax=Kibdelosporangium banguiense TaxID=1365924 RepID=A0ABS4TV29_9PSEU|nr:poly-gamma-glutamate synthase PgsB [Kibdelosporangium banguiense]MBP2327834.1 poly-gamma-glutamate synthase PgsB/CapB [Kibdelosporangium banguiense]